MEARIRAFVCRRWSLPDGSIGVRVEPLHGGLEARVTLARLTHTQVDRSIPAWLVVKEIRPAADREWAVYRWLWTHLTDPPAVRALGVERDAGATFLYLDYAEALSAWPWSDTARAAAVCRELARLHDATSARRSPPSWDYEAELTISAARTLELADLARDPAGRRYWRRLGDLKRVVRALPDIRSVLMDGEKTVIHGDLHPGNVSLRAGTGSPDVVLLDWARARVGSPFEDVASWLHSLGCWEPQARLRHDTLMQAYLRSRAVPRTLSAGVRRLYWYASASNGLAGAIRYHLAVLASSESTPSARFDAHRALRAWQRGTRQAAALLRPTGYAGSNTGSFVPSGTSIVNTQP